MAKPILKKKLVVSAAPVVKEEVVNDEMSFVVDANDAVHEEALEVDEEALYEEEDIEEALYEEMAKEALEDDEEEAPIAVKAKAKAVTKKLVAKAAPVEEDDEEEEVVVPAKPVTKAPVKPAVKATPKVVAKAAPAKVEEEAPKKLSLKKKPVSQQAPDNFNFSQLYGDELKENVIEMVNGTMPNPGERMSKETFINILSAAFKQNLNADFSKEEVTKIYNEVESCLRGVIQNNSYRFMGAMFRISDVNERFYPHINIGSATASKNFGSFMPKHKRAKFELNITKVKAYPCKMDKEGNFIEITKEELAKLAAKTSK